ncbi:MAG: hypothetical protein U1A72_13710 [Sulfuritalea sp.]|nr:hypothetical protein [Sulfuritalea sp.]
MAQLNKLWAGRVFGTNTGNLFIELESTGPAVSGTLRFLDAAYGLAVYSIVGTFGDTLRIQGHPSIEPVQKIELGVLTVEGSLTEEGNLRGTWHSSLGTAGTFEAYPHDSNLPIPAVKLDGDIPEQIYTRNISLGAIRLYGDDVKRLIRYIREDFRYGRVIATYNTRGSQVTKYVDDFLLDATALGDIAYLKIQVQELEAHGINKLVKVEFNARGANEVQVQGIRESWVVGKAEMLSGFLKNHQPTLVTTYKRFGLNLNAVIFLAMIVLLPSIDSLANRAVFVLGVVTIQQVLLAIHVRFVPNASIHVEDTQPPILERIWPTVLSWFVAASSSLAAALLFYWLTNGAS